MNNRHDVGLSRVEILVGLTIFGALVFVIFPAVLNFVASSHDHSGIQVLSNMRQLHIATRQMVLDGEAAGDNSLGWPGDTGGTFMNWQKHLVPAYVGTNDFCKLLSALGVTVPSTKFPLKAMTDGALIIYSVSSSSPPEAVLYSVSSSSPPEAVLFSSANFTNSPIGGAPLLKSAKPWGRKKFVVMRKAGDGAVLPGNRVGNPNLIGTYAPPVK